MEGYSISVSRRGIIYFKRPAITVALFVSHKKKKKKTTMPHQQHGCFFLFCFFLEEERQKLNFGDCCVSLL